MYTAEQLAADVEAIMKQHPGANPSEVADWLMKQAQYGEAAIAAEVLADAS